ncbi:hypothetical protein B0J11DRAFT_548109 [Dendryphion nanum]|uniref:Beta-glucuronidase C-terminal domain-containing protein n=1 Tax=Dendryphion nanum TaxID=256645 RepID=A0A9P9E556_9PLEO|nr:hypothetical protein B0J11DRAFT_548109 [Dendryphion nanum]
MPPSLQALLLHAVLLQTASCSPALTFLGGESLGVPLTRPPDWYPVPVPGTPDGAGEAVLNSFVSYSIELAFFPDFAGNKAKPNIFSDNLLKNVGELQGTKPNVRVGGNTQDYAIFDSNLRTATNATFIDSVSRDYPGILSIGPTFFESYQTWPNVKFIHGFNLAKDDTAATNSIIRSIPYACRAIGKNNLLSWEMGNEPDLYKTSAQGAVRPSTWSEDDYVKEWASKVQTVKDALQKGCGADWVSPTRFKWIAPSFAGPSNSLDALKAWQAGLGASNGISQFSAHNYIGGATEPGVTLSNTLLNHEKTVSSISAHIKSLTTLKAAGMPLDYILSETNSLSNQGAPNLSNSFGAALWTLDYSLYAASSNIKQIYMHQGTDYRYASWQPISTSKTAIGTKAPYYGNIAVAAALGNITSSPTRVQNLPLDSATEAAYAVFAGAKLKSLVVINMDEYNHSVPNPSPRPEVSYNFTVPATCAGSGVVQRLLANGSDAITGITFNGQSYNYELDLGRPRSMANVTKDETVWVGADGGVTVPVWWSSAAVVHFTCL